MPLLDKKISQLDPYPAPLDTDIVPVVDIATDICKKITISDLKNLFAIQSIIMGIVL